MVFVMGTHSVPYRPQTILATNHIGHDHISHTKRPYRPKGITISATKKCSLLLFSVNIYKLWAWDSKRRKQLRLTSWSVESKRTQQLSTCFKALWCEYIIARVVGVWATIHCLCSSPTVGLEQEREPEGWPTRLARHLCLLMIVDSTAHLNIAYRHGDRTFKNINTLERMLKRATKILNGFLE